MRTADLVPSAHYAGSFYAGTGLYLVAAAAPVAHRRARRPPRVADPTPPRRLREIAAQPVFRVAVLAALASYTVMSFIMTATPISMHVVDGHDEVATARVIQVHLLGMYLPSLASGWIIAKFGDRPVIVAGTLLMAGCVAIAVYAGPRRPALRLGARRAGPRLEPAVHRRDHDADEDLRRGERIQAQTLNDFLVFGAQAVASLLAGVAVTTIGWERLNLATLPLLAAVLLATLALGRRRPAAATA